MNFFNNFPEILRLFWLAAVIIELQMKDRYHFFVVRNLSPEFLSSTSTKLIYDTTIFPLTIHLVKFRFEYNERWRIVRFHPFSNHRFSSSVNY